MSHSEAPTSTSSYRLSSPAVGETPALNVSARRLAPFLREERGPIALAFGAVLLSSLTSLLGPLVIGRTVDTYVAARDLGGVLRSAAALLGIYVVGLVATYWQTRLMGTVGRRVIFAIRNSLFERLQDLPLAFFNENRAGDLISRINNDTDKLQQFFAQGLVQFAGNLVMMAGAAVFLVAVDARLGLATLAPAAAVIVVTRVLSPWVRRRNAASLRSLGAMSGEIQESLANFKVIVAFNRRDYFRERFERANSLNYAASVGSGLASGLFLPLYGLAYNLGQAIALIYGLALVLSGGLTVGVLLSAVLYVNSFYQPLRQLAAIWASFQLALAAVDRIAEVLSLRTTMPDMPTGAREGTALLALEDVWFSYPGGHEVLRSVSMTLERGRTYALVGPTGGGKTTTASLMARLYDPTRGRILLDGRDIRSYPAAERARRIGFILQEPFLFTGTVGENIAYGNERLRGGSPAAIAAALEAHGLADLLARFPAGLETPVASTGDSLSLGQKQIVAFIRAVLREPELLILDEATANIDTVTEQVLTAILERLPPSTTRVIIAHRLNTIARADEIFFINACAVTPAGSLDHAVEMLLHGRRAS